ncbi:TetR/AcrR family transcriptional regulator [Actinocatenispora rupis]|uniref:TetR family transcriptional regulator n=1 Tax=Actinocatenispora rupis TaxID=519421 RepID=A0A8J3J2J3_9ACTN|nr:TetR/AcrR family transcriptional regulator [Actinocatenispora rupis]GID13395.1 TetR family transcriptional regulator [Actinocatenispora rupis]
MPVAKGTSLDPARTRDAILASATELLYERGLDGAGVADLCSAVGASKETLYRHFGSKDGLIEAALEARSERVLRWLTGAAEAAGDAPAARLAAIFDALGGWYAEPGFRGCAIVNSAVQHHHAAPVRAVAGRHLDRYLHLLIDIAERAGADHPRRLARQLLMLIEGATVLADHAGTDARGSAASDARQAALDLLHAVTYRQK